MTETYTMNLTLGETVWIDTERGGNAYDTCSIQSESDAWGSGVVAVQKTNSKTKAPVAFGTPVAISATTLTELTGTDWNKAQYIALVCTTAASATTTAHFSVTLKRLGSADGGVP